MKSFQENLHTYKMITNECELSQIKRGTQRDYNLAWDIGHGIRKAWHSFTKPFKAQKVY